ncbi:MarR family winged helix-turn-helix transcriptional regulator [Streptomyces sp. Sge12]|uniref:MarR family winged helix-turn-helix transcriptional regulator n=1 Tax=unclassified Streptomyces TaxID=2593676 RepID=UPI001F002202|nr:MarR family transcriptional regulator [Streptomyces sp. Sge12]
MLDNEATDKQVPGWPGEEMPRIAPSVSREQVALEACRLLEMLEVLWGRSGEASSLPPVSPSQLRVLTVIEKWDGVNLRDLGEALGSTPPSVSRLCDRLEAAGLIQRSRGTANRREVELRLSPGGHRALKQMRAWRSGEIEAVLTRVPEADLGALAESLQTFRTAARLHIGPEETGHSTGSRTA